MNDLTTHPDFLQAGMFGTETTLKAKRPGSENEGVQSRSKGGANGGDGSATGGADPWYTRHSPNTIRLSIYNRELQFRHYRVPRKQPHRAKGKAYEDDPGHTAANEKDYTPPVRRHGDITQFSRKSRLRMLRMFNRIQHVLMGDPIFVTLTARPECLEYIDIQEQFQKTFIPMMRQVIPKAEYIWKMEPHRDGRAHYHLIVWSRYKERKIHSQFYARKLRQLWRNCINDNSRASELYSCKINQINDERGCFAYLSKYMFKEETAETASIRGRRWGKSKSLPISPILEKAVQKSQYDRMKEAAIEIIKAKKRNVDNQLDWINQGNDWFVWLDDDEMIQVLKAGNCLDLWGMLKRFRATGTVGWQNSELEQIAAEHGHDF